MIIKRSVVLLFFSFFGYRYIAWQVHERVEGQYDFDGENDFVHFTQLAGSLGLLVIIRAGKLNAKCKSVTFQRPFISFRV